MAEKGNEGEARRDTSGKELIKRTCTGNSIFKQLQWSGPGPQAEVFVAVVEIVEIEVIRSQNCMVGRPQKQTTSPRRQKAVKR